MLNTELGTDLAAELQTLEGFSETQPEYIVKLKGLSTVKYVELAERISEGQRISNFQIYTKTKDGYWDKAEQGTTVGSRKIVKIDPTETDEIKVRIMASRDVPDMEWIKVY